VLYTPFSDGLVLACFLTKFLLNNFLKFIFGETVLVVVMTSTSGSAYVARQMQMWTRNFDRFMLF